MSVPVLIHLFSNRRIQRVRWAAMRFLKTTVEKNQKQLNLEDLLLLLLRCLLVALLALALARPALRKAGAAAFGRGGETAVIAIDNSYSMSQSDGGPSRFDKAKIAAEQVLDAMPSGSSAAVFLVSDLARMPIPEPTFDTNLARKVIREARLSDRVTDLQPGIRQALETLKRQASLGKQLYVITDGQAAGWKNIEGIRQMLEEAKGDARSRIILVSEGEEQNVGVSALRLGSAMAPLNQPLRFEVEVTNFGTTEARGLQVDLSADGETPSDQGTFDVIPAGAARTISLFIKLRDEGFHTVTARVPKDHLPADDQRTVAVRAVKQANVLLVDGEPGVEPRESELFFVRNALVPVRPEVEAEYFLKTKTIAPGELQATKLSDYDAVILGNVVDVSAGTLAEFEKYLQQGGGLVVFPGGKINVKFYNETLHQKFGFIPAELGDLRGKADDQKNPFALQVAGYAHPIVSIWNDPGAGTLGSANFYAAFPLKPSKSEHKEAGEPVVVLSFKDGTPAVVESEWGFGRCILFASTADTAWNDLPVRPSFVPLIQRVLGRILNRQDERLNIGVGSRFAFVCPPDLIGKDAEIVSPGDEKRPPAVRKVTLVNGVPLLQFDETDLAGEYSVTFRGENAKPLKFAVQANPEESKLQPVAQSQLDALAPISQVIRWTPSMKLKDSIEQERTGTELWFTVAVLAFVAAVGESVLGNFFSKVK